MSKVIVNKSLSEVWVHYPQVGEIYKHYKGGRYRIITLAQHTETNEILVIYNSTLFGTVYARPLNMWFDDIELKGSLGEYDTRRFMAI